jgi:hypothetical protein
MLTFLSREIGIPLLYARRIGALELQPAKPLFGRLKTPLDGPFAMIAG